MNTDTASAKTLYLQVYEQFKRDILEGVYSAGQKLPPIRKLADDLGVARNTVEAAYRQLLQEGFVSSKQGSGYTVEQIILNERRFATTVHESIDAYSNYEKQLITDTQSPLQSYRYDFCYGNLENDAFPTDIWRRLTADALHSAEAAGANSYGDNQGDYLLRLNIVNHLRKSRGVRCFPEQIVIQAGTQAGVQNLLQLFDATVDTVAMEEPGYDKIRSVFERSRFNVIPCAVYEGPGSFVRYLSTSGAKLCFVTPSNQFPTGAILPVQARLQLLEWARASDAYLLEDDCCREFRYNAHPVPPLQSLDTYHRVIYLGTFSKTLSPALRVSYLILPPDLLGRWQEHFRGSYSDVPWLSQVVLRRFIEQGHWERLLRRALTRNKQKREVLITALSKYMKSKIALTENGAGLHLLVKVKDGRSQEELVEQAASRGVRVYETSPYWMSKGDAQENHILIGFSSIKKEDIEPGIKMLAKAWFG